MKLHNGLELAVAKAEEDDADDIIRYLNIVGGESDNLLFGANGFLISADEEKKIIRRLKDSAVSALLVGKIDGNIVSVGSVSSDSRERVAHQADVALSVKKEFWHMGIATEMMKTIVGFAKQNGITEVLHLGVRADNVYAIQLYKKMGFEEIGLYKKYVKINGVYQDDLLMNLYL